MSDNQKITVLRFAIIFLLIALGFLAVIVQIVVIQTGERETWLAFAEKQVMNDRPIAATRGNIMDADGRILVSSMPQFLIYMDAGVKPLHQNKDSLFLAHIDSLSSELSRIVGDKTPAEYRTLITRAHRANKRSIRLSKKRINYLQKQEIEQITLVKKGKNTSGITFKQLPLRIKPFGNLASRTIGHVNNETGNGTSGLEARFNSELRGTDGVSTRQKVGDRWEDTPIVEAVDGLDIVTTLDANLQDITETALRRRLEHTSADWGCCILMETSTGKIKAICNLDRQDDGTYSEHLNHAVTRIEPGSTFKTMALMAALDDGKIDIDDTIRIYRNGWNYLGINHHDAHAKDTVLTVQNALAISSNIALAKIITQGYEGSAKKFVNRIRKMGLKDSLYCEIPGAQTARIDIPKDTVTLSKMSYGYSVELTPMQILMFYNGIANDGCMLRPYLVSEIRDGDKVVRSFNTETVRSSLCKNRTLRDIRAALHDVVWDNTLGTASVNPWGMRKAQSDLVHIAGKTGTAQLFRNGRYQNHQHRMTFVGYFPEDNPQYTCICVIEHPKNYPAYDAGMDCGSVVRQIAEKTIAYAGCYRIRNHQRVFEKQ